MITAVPAKTPVTVPVAFTVAMAVLEDTQAFDVAGAAVLDKRVVAASQTLKVPVIIGSGLTVTTIVC